MSLLLSLGLAGLALVALTRGLSISPYAAMGFSVLIFLGAMFFLGTRRGGAKALEKPKPKAKRAGPRNALVDELIAEATPRAERLKAAARSIGDQSLRQRFTKLGELAGAVLDALEENPEQLTPVRRFLVYYLPGAAEIAEGAAQLSRQPAPDVKRYQELLALAGRMEEAFAQFSHSFVETDLSRLDLEMKLMKDALDEDLGRKPHPEA